MSGDARLAVGHHPVSGDTELAVGRLGVPGLVSVWCHQILVVITLALTKHRHATLRRRSCRALNSELFLSSLFSLQLSLHVSLSISLSPFLSSTFSLLFPPFL